MKPFHQEVSDTIIDNPAVPRELTSTPEKATLPSRTSVEPAVLVPMVGQVRTKYIALVLLVAQTVGVVTIMRYSRMARSQSITSSSPGSSAAPVKSGLYLNTTAVFFSEVFKLVGSIVLVLHENHWKAFLTLRQLYTTIFRQPKETCKIGVPAVLYTVQNNLIFIALSHISAAAYQVTYQLKILTTAILSVLLLNKELGLQKWAALLCLTIGVTITEWPSSHTAPSVATTGTINESITSSRSFYAHNQLIGVSAVLLACVTSGFAGVYFEKMLKGATVSIWLRNVQLALFGTILAWIGVYWNDAAAVQRDGFLQGYTWIVWVVILLQSLGGLIVAAVLKYADNILKCFANALALIMSFCVGIFILKDSELTIMFLFGILLVIFSSYMYTVDDLSIFQRVKLKTSAYSRRFPYKPRIRRNSDLQHVPVIIHGHPSTIELKRSAEL